MMLDQKIISVANTSLLDMQKSKLDYLRKNYSGSTSTSALADVVSIQQQIYYQLEQALAAQEQNQLQVDDVTFYDCDEGNEDDDEVIEFLAPGYDLGRC